MLIVYVGHLPAHREVGVYIWNADNGYTQLVDDAETVADLLTNPGPDFAVAADDPLLALGVPAEACLGLAMAGIASHIALAAVTDVARVAVAANLPEPTITAWQRTALQAIEENCDGTQRIGSPLRTAGPSARTHNRNRRGPTVGSNAQVQGSPEHE